MLDDKLVKKILETGLSKARDIDLGMSIAVVDSAGLLVGFLRHADADYGSTIFALDKAYTAAMNRMTTDELGKLCQPGCELYGLQTNLGGRMVIFGGGIPLKDEEGVWIGAVGVSGGAVSQDMEVAEYIVKQLFNY